MLKFYYSAAPNPTKIALFLEETATPYTILPVNIGTGEQFKPDFLKIAPNNRMPAIVDPQGPGNRPISIFESGAILQYLGRKTGKFYPAGERARVAVDEWLFWQMANLGPKAGDGKGVVLERAQPKPVHDRQLGRGGALPGRRGVEEEPRRELGRPRDRLRRDLLLTQNCLRLREREVLGPELGVRAGRDDDGRLPCRVHRDQRDPGRSVPGDPPLLHAGLAQSLFSGSNESRFSN